MAVTSNLVLLLVIAFVVCQKVEGYCPMFAAAIGPCLAGQCPGAAICVGGCCCQSVTAGQTQGQTQPNTCVNKVNDCAGKAALCTNPLYKDLMATNCQRFCGLC
uniref:ShKT domain-containing protein n=1 Tax=Plectus sambesii TaxID=2011161 RepID=A0A914VD23_9BILA